MIIILYQFLIKNLQVDIYLYKYYKLLTDLYVSQMDNENDEPQIIGQSQYWINQILK